MDAREGLSLAMFLMPVVELAACLGASASLDLALACVSETVVHAGIMVPEANGDGRPLHRSDVLLEDLVVFLGDLVTA